MPVSVSDFLATFPVEPCDQVTPHETDLLLGRHNACRWQFQGHYGNTLVKPGVISQRARGIHQADVNTTRQFCQVHLPDRQSPANDKVHEPRQLHQVENLQSGIPAIALQAHCRHWPLENVWDCSRCFPANMPRHWQTSPGMENCDSDPRHWHSGVWLCHQGDHPDLPVERTSR